MNILIVANKNAGKGLTDCECEKIVKSLSPIGTVHRVLSTTQAQTKRSLEEYRQWFDVIVLVGGDGTFRTCINICRQLDICVPIAMIPHGTGNDFIRSLTQSTAPENLLMAINSRDAYDVHYCDAGDELFMNVASAGLDAAIVERQKKLKQKIKGPLSYVLSTLLTIFSFNYAPIGLTIDGRDCGDAYTLIAVANGRYYGGGMKIAPAASPFQDYIQVVALQHIPRLFLPFLFPLIYFGWHTKLPFVNTWRAKEVVLTSAKTRAFNLDGDIIHGKQLTIQKNDQTLVKIHLSNPLK